MRWWRGQWIKALELFLNDWEIKDILSFSVSVTSQWKSAVIMNTQHCNSAEQLKKGKTHWHVVCHRMQHVPAKLCFHWFSPTHTLCFCLFKHTWLVPVSQAALSPQALLASNMYWWLYQKKKSSFFMLFFLLVFCIFSFVIFNTYTYCRK